MTSKHAAQSVALRPRPVKPDKGDNVFEIEDHVLFTCTRMRTARQALEEREGLWTGVLQRGSHRDVYSTCILQRGSHAHTRTHTSTHVRRERERERELELEYFILHGL